MEESICEIRESAPLPSPTMPEAFSSKVPPLLWPQPMTCLGKETGLPEVEDRVTVSVARLPLVKDWSP